MLSGNALRHQIIMPEQQEFYDYWRSKCRAPEDICGQLPMTTLIERVKGDNIGQHRYRHRLAGTGFWKLYEGEIQGRHVDELPIGNRVEYWHRVLDKVIGSHMAMFWVRLPLSENGTDIDTILGFDHLVKMSDVAELAPAREKVVA